MFSHSFFGASLAVFLHAKWSEVHYIIEKPIKIGSPFWAFLKTGDFKAACVCHRERERDCLNMECLERERDCFNMECLDNKPTRAPTTMLLFVRTFPERKIYFWVEKLFIWFDIKRVRII